MKHFPLLLLCLFPFTGISAESKSKDLTPREYWASCGTASGKGACFNENFDPIFKKMCVDSNDKVKKDKDCVLLFDYYLAGLRQREAHLALLALYSAQMAYFADHGSYSQNLKDLYKPHGKDNRFIVSLMPKCVEDKKTSLDFGQQLSSSVAREQLLRGLQSIKGTQCPDPKKGFMAVALGFAHPSNGQMDIWGITEKKQIVRMLSSMKESPFIE